MSNILRFFIKRVCVLYVVMLIVCFLSKNQRIPMMVALTLTVFFSILRFALLESVLRFLGKSGSKKLAIIATLMIYLFSLAIIGLTIVLAMRFGISTLLAALIGSLSIIIIVMINAITEGLGITRNHYGQKVK